LLNTLPSGFFGTAGADDGVVAAGVELAVPDVDAAAPPEGATADPPSNPDTVVPAPVTTAPTTAPAALAAPTVEPSPLVA
jgi:hypothetical protein